LGKGELFTRLTKLVPIIHWFPRYRPEWLRFDIVAAIVVVGLIIPESMGIAGVAGVPPQYGLYSILIALFLYAIFGSGKRSMVSTPSALAILTATAVGGIVLATNEDAVQVVLSVTILVGIMLLVAAILRLGFLADFISFPVMKGFLFGLALTIIIGQVPKLLGVEKGTGNFFDQVYFVLSEIGDSNLSTVALAGAAIAVMVVLESRFKKLPAVLILFVAALFLSYIMDFEGNFDIAVVGTIPQGLPALAAPAVDLSTLDILIPAAIGIAFVCFAESIAIGEEVAERHKDEIDPNQELVALAATNLGAGVTQGISNGVSMSASMVADNSGVRSPMALIFAGLMVMAVLLFLTGVFYYIPEAVLGVIVIFAVMGALKFKLMVRFYHTQRNEFHLAMLALFGVLIFEVLVGLVLAVVIAIALMVWKLSRVGGELVGQMPSPTEFRQLRESPEAKEVPGLKMYMIDGAMFYANSSLVKKEIKALVMARPRPNMIAIVLIETMHELDITSTRALESAIMTAQEEGVEVVLVSVPILALSSLRKAGIVELVGEDHIMNDLYTMVNHYRQKYGADKDVGHGSGSDQ